MGWTVFVLVFSALKANVAADPSVQADSRAAHRALRGPRRPQLGPDNLHVLELDQRGGSAGQTFDEALGLVNRQLAGVFLQSDLLASRCEASREASTALIEAARKDVVFYSGQLTEARGDIVRNQMDIQSMAVKLPELQDQALGYESRCKDEVEALRKEVSAVSHDVQAMEGVLEQTSCGGLPASLLQANHVRGRFGHSGQVLLGHGRHRARNKLRSRRVTEEHWKSPSEVLANVTLRSDTTRDMLNEVMQAIDADEKVLSRHRARLHSQGHHPVVARKTSSRPGSRACPHCRTKINPNCEHMRDKVMQVKAAAADNHGKLVDKMSSVQLTCKEGQDGFNSEISSVQAAQRSANTNLALATSQQNQIQQNWLLRSSELTQLRSDFARETSSCQSQLAEFQDQVCGFQKMRGELAVREGRTDTFVDCKPSAWIPGECSATCGGGTQRLTRSVINVPVNGAPCPPLSMVQACAHEPCPVDCELDSWGGWSACSADCGGGVRERQRSIRSKPSSTGRPCGGLTDAQRCNVQSCEETCRLDRWTDWSPCSKPCGLGTQRSSRGVLAGAALCPEPDSSQRLRFRTCSLRACPGDASGEGNVSNVLPACGTSSDVILLVDGSGAVGNVGWDALREAAAVVVEAVARSAGRSRLAVQIFGNEISSSRCSSPAATSEDVDLMADCGIQWLSHLTDVPSTSTAEALRALSFPAGSALISAALGAAEGELQHGRESAASTVVVLTAGMPISRARTAEAAASLQQRARVVWVPVIRGHAESWGPLKDMEAWASRPLHENLLAVEGYATLRSETAIAKLIGEICAGV